MKWLPSSLDGSPQRIMASNPYDNNANTNVYFLNAKINGPETVINPHSTLPQSSTGNQIPVFLAASSSTGGQYAATLPQQANVSRQQTHEVLNEHKTHCACTDLPNAQNSASGEVPVKLNVPNYSGPYATLPQPIQNIVGNIPVLLNVHHRQRQQFQTGSDPSSMMSVVDQNGVGGWYPAVNVVRTRVKESELQNMLNWPIVPETEEVLDARPPPIRGNESTQRKPWQGNKKPVEEEEEEKEDLEPNQDDSVNKSSCLDGLAIASCVFAMFMILLGAANLIVYIAFKSVGKYPCTTFSAYLITGSHTSPYIGFESGIGILTILEVPSSVAVLSFVSVIIAAVVWPSEFLTFVSSAGSSSAPCLATAFMSFFVLLSGFVEFILSVILCIIVMVKRKQALQARASKTRKNRHVTKSKRNVVSAVKTKEPRNSESNRKERKQVKRDCEGEDDEEEDEDGKYSNWGSDDDSQLTEESETDYPTSKQTEQSNIRIDSKNTQATHTSTPCLPSALYPVPRPDIPCAPLGSINPGFAANPYNQATMDNGYMWGRYQPFQYNGRVAFSLNKF